jgi:DNA topoisomerase-2
MSKVASTTATAAPQKRTKKSITVDDGAGAGAAKTLTADEQYIVDTYDKKEIFEHILQTPDMYLGSVNVVDKKMHVFDDATGKIVHREIQYIPGLYKLFDEAIVNSRDHIIRMQVAAADAAAAGEKAPKQVTYIAVDVAEDGTITVTNDGDSVAVAKHPTLGVWVPELIFAHAMTGTNFNKSDSDIIGGKNGYGAKLAVVWSTYAAIDISDPIRGLHYFQEFRDNRAIIGEPQVTKIAKSAKPHTRFIFRPDFARFGIPDGLTADYRALFKKRAYDIAAVTDKGVRVTYCGEPVPVKSFQQYVDFYIGEKATAGRVYKPAAAADAANAADDAMWDYAVGLSPSGEFQQVSFVNSIHTSKGGTHVNYILNQIVGKLKDYILVKRRMEVADSIIKAQLILFVNSNIVKPAFDSQTKEALNTPSSKFGSKCEVPTEFIEKVAKGLGVMELVCTIAGAKQLRQMTAAAENGGGFRQRVNIPKLDDAEYAGHPTKWVDAGLLPTEGDSAKVGVVSGLDGLSVEQRKYIGVYPLKGKTLNVRDAPITQVLANEEIANFIKIMGLQLDKTYADPATSPRLRYGYILMCTDSDADGSHIRGLIINLIHHLWPALARRPGFLRYMNTPLLKAIKGKQRISFYNRGEYDQWLAATPGAERTWTFKYYKGLGTSTKSEWKEYFADPKFVNYVHVPETSDDRIDMAFRKSRADDRKAWLDAFDPNAYIATATSVTYDDFIDRELIHFSHGDNIRSIPSVVDGLKPSLRKVLYSAFKRGLREQMKVAQFAGYVAEHSEYHHGEASLHEAIVGMAQNFVGSNNINLLDPCGQFGTRIMGGKEHASPRYIFTRLEAITRAIFHADDDAIMNYLVDDGSPIEPQYYVPILPMLLVNGSEGIGTGYNTKVPCFNPRDLIAYIRARLLNPGAAPLDAAFIPFYEGFNGTVETTAKPATFLIKGTYVRNTTAADTITVTELPAGMWTQTFKDHLTALLSPADATATTAAAKSAKKDTKLEKAKAKLAKASTKKSTAASAADDASDSGTNTPEIVDFVPDITDSTVSVCIRFAKGRLAALEAQTTEHPGCNGVHKLLKLYTTISTTNMNAYDAEGRLRLYRTPKDIADAHFDVRMEYYTKRKARLVADLERNLVKISNRAKFILEVLAGTVDLRRKSATVIQTMLTDKGYALIDGKYTYLTDMSLMSLSQERVDALLKEKAEKDAELAAVLAADEATMWLRDLDALETAYAAFVVRRVNKLAGNDDDYADNDCTESGAGATAAPVAKKRAVVSKKK